MFPARPYAVKGERRSFALLSPITDTMAQDAIRDRILEAYAEYEERAAAADACQPGDSIQSRKAAAQAGR